jgi:peptidoglycan/xylan/chitin deacetylase (PgdA/CDA1 family)
MYNMLDNPAVVLLYHRVTDLEQDPQQLSVTPANFFEHVTMIRKTYTPVLIEEFADLLIHGKELPKKTVILSFDDGYADNLNEALPILESNGSQALFYIATNLINSNKEFWWDELERILLAKQFAVEKIELKSAQRNVVLKTSTFEQRRNSYESLHPILKYASLAERDELISQLRTQAGLSVSGRATHRVMTKEEIQRLANSTSAVIGAHSHRHPALSILSSQEQQEEISISKNILQEITGKSIDHFSYPFGSKKDYNQETVRICGQIGFKMVAANYYGQVHRWTDRFQLPRILVRNWNRDDFSKNMQTFLRS